MGFTHKVITHSSTLNSLISYSFLTSITCPFQGLLPSDDAAKIKCCLHCNTTTTPLWRGGPAGPKVSSLFPFIIPFIFFNLAFLLCFCSVFAGFLLCSSTRSSILFVLILSFWYLGCMCIYLSGYLILISYMGFLQSLCNACGIRFRKRRISALGCDRKRDRLHNNSSTVSASSSCSGTTATRDGEEDLGECGSLRMRLMMAFGEEGVVVVQNLPSSVKKQRCQRRRKLGEEEEQEQAAVSLMALSCGSVFGWERGGRRGRYREVEYLVV